MKVILLLTVVFINITQASEGLRELNNFEDLSCSVTDDCPLAPYNICVNGQCEHKEVFPIYPKEWVGTLILSCFTVLSNVGGIGGGGVIIPITMAMFGFSTKEAIANTRLLILSTSFTRFVLQFNLKHP